MVYLRRAECATLGDWYNITAFRETLHWHGSSSTGGVKPAVVATLSTGGYSGTTAAKRNHRAPSCPATMEIPVTTDG